ncbi:MAG: hypothetical protein ACI4DO_07570 [Roseburia sp.]
MKTKAIPAIVMLIAGFISCVISIYKGQDFLTFAKSLILVMLIFYVIGGIAALLIQKSILAAKEENKEQSEETEGDEKTEENDTNTENATKSEKETKTGKG